MSHISPCRCDRGQGGAFTCGSPRPPHIHAFRVCGKHFPHQRRALDQVQSSEEDQHHDVPTPHKTTEHIWGPVHNGMFGDMFSFNKMIAETPYPFNGN